MIYNAYSYSPEYNEKISGVSNVKLVKNLGTIYPKRAGAIVYYEKIKEQIIEPKKLQKIVLDETPLKDLPILSITPLVSKKNPRPFGSVKILRRETKKLEIMPIVNHKPNLIKSVEEKYSIKINDRSKNVVDNVILDITKPETNRFFCFGVDSKYHTLTDFGGGIKYKLDGDPVLGALRELREESLGLFDFSKDSVQNCCCIYNNDILIIFIRILIDPIISTLFFQFLVSKEPTPEVAKLEWINQIQLAETIQHPYVVYEPVRSLINETFSDFVNCINVKSENLFLHKCSQVCV